MTTVTVAAAAAATVTVTVAAAAETVTVAAAAETVTVAAAAAAETVTVAAATWMSIYIPTIPHDVMLNGKSFGSVEDIKDFFENKLAIGNVKRVDLITKPRGNNQTISAFIHFNEWFTASDPLRDFMESNGGEYRCTGYFDYTTGENSTFYSKQNRSFDRFITFKINKNPIPEIAPMAASELNIHQLVNSLELARATIAENEARLAEQAKRIAELEEMLVVWGKITNGPMTNGPMTIAELSIDTMESTNYFNKSSYA